jgi:glutathione S-transferase
MFNDAGYDYVDDVANIGEIFGGGLWPKMKFDFDFSGHTHALPLIKHKGITIQETCVCASYVAEVCGYLPKDPLLKHRALMIVAHIYEDVTIEVAYAIWCRREWERDVFGGFSPPNGGVPLKFINLEKFLEDNGTGYAVGDSVSIADFAIHMIVDQMIKFLRPAGEHGEEAFQALVGNKPHLLKHHAMMSTRPNLKAYREGEAFANYGRFLTGKGPFGETTNDMGFGPSEAAQWTTMATKLVTLMNSINKPEAEKK